eukprot:SAG11_NODE_5562_length_1524_cov_1.960702_1_plen_313_part_01
MDDQREWLAHLGEDVSSLADAGLVLVLLFYVSHLPNMLRLALRALRAREPPPSVLTVFGDDERTRRHDIPLPAEPGGPAAPPRDPSSGPPVGPPSPHARGAPPAGAAPSPRPDGGGGGVAAEHAAAAAPVAASSGTSSFLSSREAELDALQSALFARFDRLERDRADDQRRFDTLQDELARERAARTALEARLQDEIDGFGARLQQQLLDVDLVLPSGANAKLLRKARSFELDDSVVAELKDYGIIPESGFEFTAEHSLGLLLHPDEVSRNKLRIPPVAGLPDPSFVDQPVYDAMAKDIQSNFNRAKSSQEYR